MEIAASPMVKRGRFDIDRVATLCICYITESNSSRTWCLIPATQC